jgi:hypothetical protein
MAKAKPATAQTQGSVESDMGAEVKGPATAGPSLSKAKTVKARVLAACFYGEPNDVVEIEESLAALLPGVIDTNPAAVTCAESLKANSEE